MRSRARATLLMTVLLAGCGSGGTEHSGFSLAGTAWVLEHGVPAGDAPPTMRFAERDVSGFNGCNQYSGPYTTKGSSISFGHLAATQKACSGAGDATERAFMKALSQVDHWEADGERLTLTGVSGSVTLRFAVASLAGSWTATGINTGDAIKSVIIGTEVTADFNNGTLGGSAGCNTYETTYTTDGDAIRIAPPPKGTKTCSTPEGVMEQERDYLAALGTARRYQLDGAKLTLLTAKGTIAVTYARG